MWVEILFSTQITFFDIKTHFQNKNVCAREKVRWKKCMCNSQPHQSEDKWWSFSFQFLVDAAAAVVVATFLYTWLVIISAVRLSINRPKFSRSLNRGKKTAATTTTQNRQHWKSEAHFSFRQTSSTNQPEFRWLHEKMYIPNTALVHWTMWMWKMAYLRIGYIGSLLTKYRSKCSFFLLLDISCCRKMGGQNVPNSLRAVHFFFVRFLSSSPSSSSSSFLLFY